MGPEQPIQTFHADFGETVVVQVVNKGAYELRLERTSVSLNGGLAAIDGRAIEPDDLIPRVSEVWSAYTHDGLYLGDEEMAELVLVKLGIKPELSPNTDADGRNPCCSIGFREKDQKWYGWSHRAYNGFGIGSAVVIGDCAYMPSGWDDFLAAQCAFWSGGRSINVRAERATNDDGVEFARVQWDVRPAAVEPDILEWDAVTPVDDGNANEGQITGVDDYPPESWGRGEWTASTLDDARQMAIDFAENV